MYSKFNIECKVNCNQYGALLSGATGALGFGGSGGGVGTQQAAPSATAGDITSGDITPTTSGLTGGGFKPNINISIPPPQTPSLGDINLPLEVLKPMNLVWIAVALSVIFVFFLIFGRK